MRAVAPFLVAIQLLLAAHGLWHHHDEEHADEHGTTCAYCLILRQPPLPPPPQPLILAAVPTREAHRDQPRAFVQAERHSPASIRGPPRSLAG